MGISFWQLAIVFIIVILIFGTKKLRNMGTDVGGAIKGFKKAMGEEEHKPQALDNDKKNQNEPTNNSQTTEHKDS